jgi:hypothetical protein
VFVFSWIAFFILFGVSSILQDSFKIQHPGKVIPAIALFLIPVIFFALHQFGVFAESRGWIFYRHPRTGGIKAGVALDLEVLLTARPTNQIENLRKAYEAHNESAKQDGEGDKPLEKKTYVHE